MALSDEVKKYDRTAYKGHDIDSGLDASLFFHNRKNKDAFENSVESYLESLSVLDSPIGRITSRDQIINPDELINTSMYANNVQGRALMDNDLQRARTYAEQQEAAYQEWYDSPEQQAIRQRAAGQNPNLMEYSGGESSDITPQNVSPMAGLPTNGEIAVNAVSGITSIFSSISSLAALPASIGAAWAAADASKAAAGLSRAQKEATEVATLGAVEKYWFGAISDNLSDAYSAAVTSGESFDFDKWISEESNFAGIFESGVPDGVTVEHPRYGAAWQRVKKNIQRAKAGAYSTTSANLQSEDTIGQLLANPYRDNDVLLAAAFYEPLMKRRAETEKILADYEYTLANLRSPEKAAAAENAEYDYKTNYFQNVASEEDAARVLKIQLENQVLGGKADIVSAYRCIWNDKSVDAFQRYRAASIICGLDRFNATELGVLFGLDLGQILSDATKDNPADTGENIFDNPAGQMPLNWRNKPISFGD